MANLETPRKIEEELAQLIFVEKNHCKFEQSILISERRTTIHTINHSNGSLPILLLIKALKQIKVDI
jgi:hypothetical protein